MATNAEGRHTAVGHEENGELVLGYVGSCKREVRMDGGGCRRRGSQKYTESVLQTFLVEEDLEGFDELVGDTLVDTHPRLTKNN